MLVVCNNLTLSKTVKKSYKYPYRKDNYTRYIKKTVIIYCSLKTS